MHYALYDAWDWHLNSYKLQFFCLPTVTTVDMQKPPPDFRSNFEATPPPILIDGGLAVLENEKIERYEIAYD